MLKFENVTKKYDGKIILDDISFEIDSGDFVFIVGPSGCGKTTIFKLLILDEKIDSGKIYIDDYEITNLNKKFIPMLRQQIGVVFQDYKLIPNKNVFENIAFVLEISGKKEKAIDEIVTNLLELVSLTDRKLIFPDQLSGGEKQKVAIARAMAINPKVLIADEPTGNLDHVATWEVVDILEKINKSGTTVIMATHEIDIVNKLDKRVIEIKNGKIINDINSNKYIIDAKKEERPILEDISSEKLPTKESQNNIADSSKSLDLENILKEEDNERKEERVMSEIFGNENDDSVDKVIKKEDDQNNNVDITVSIKGKIASSNIFEINLLDIPEYLKNLLIQNGIKTIKILKGIKDQDLLSLGLKNTELRKIKIALSHLKN